MKKYLGKLVLFFSLLGLAPSVNAGSLVMLDPTSVATDIDTNVLFDITRIIDQSGLSSTHTSGVTDFDTFTSSATTSVSEVSTIWSSAPGNTSGNIDFTLGGSYTISSFAVWTIAGPSEIAADFSLKDFTLLASDNSSFTGATTLGSFTASKPTNTTAVNAQVFDFTETTASYVRMEIANNYGGDRVRLNEVAFGAQAPAVPEPSSFVLLGLGGFGLAINAYRRHRTTA